LQEFDFVSLCLDLGVFSGFPSLCFPVGELGEKMEEGPNGLWRYFTQGLMLLVEEVGERRGKRETITGRQNTLICKFAGKRHPAVKQNWIHRLKPAVCWTSLVSTMETLQ